MPDGPRPLTDAQVWAILTASATITARDLARQMGLPHATVAARRSRLRREPWTCRVHHVTCVQCHELAIVPLKHIDGYSPIAHHTCRADARRAYFRQHHADHPHYGPRLSDTVVAQRLRDTHPRHTAPWTPEEDAYLRVHAEDDLADIVVALGRTLSAVMARRSRLGVRRASARWGER